MRTEYLLDKNGNLRIAGQTLECMYRPVDCGTACPAFELGRTNAYGAPGLGMAVLHCCKRTIRLQAPPVEKAA